MLPGVYLAYKKNGTAYYRSNITFQNKHISLGSFATELEAHQAYRDAASLLFDSSTAIHDVFSLPTILSFHKVISLLNFRDNHIYFKNPIYLKNNYFVYYLSPTEELKFDIDDLFYYSNRKIMRRQGHLFVNDYGMQVNILSRYGIKNYAVAGRDYYFVNEDPWDLRYSNIVVVNRYYGVTRIDSPGGRTYKAQIHINGIYLVGLYQNEEMAAVAYNKAVDLAKKNGITKNFLMNYVEEYSPRQYAEIYSSIRISEKYLDYLQKLNSNSHESSNLSLSNLFDKE
ncbi:MAG: hypothetical protein HFI71_09960 [Lachnospiraceae bacterium]|nr:hypothetical protein [Lachnospiraceae bacterium]